MIVQMFSKYSRKCSANKKKICGKLPFDFFAKQKQTFLIQRVYLNNVLFTSFDHATSAFGNELYARLAKANR